MALSFNKAAGGAKKSSITSYSYRDGDNEVRLVGDVLARYVYWLEGRTASRFLLSVCRLTVMKNVSTTKKKIGFVSTTPISSVAGATLCSVLTMVK